MTTTTPIIPDRRGRPEKISMDSAPTNFTDTISDPAGLHGGGGEVTLDTGGGLYATPAS